MRFKILAFLVFILLTATVSAVMIEQKELNFENILQYGHAEKIVKISSDRTEPVQITLSATEPIKEWISFDPASAHVNLGAPAEFKVIVEPLDASLGVYQGYVIVHVLSSGNALTTTVATATDIKTTVGITDEEITQSNVEEVIVKDFEVGNPLKISILIENKGNMPVLPYFEMNILDINKENVLQTFVSEEKTLNPASLGLIEEEISNELSIGKYYADIAVKANGMILREHLLSFFVVEPGKIPVEESPHIQIQPAPIPLSSGWIVIAAWAVLLILVVWVIKKEKKKR
jgi:hypothetical protein